MEALTCRQIYGMGNSYNYRKQIQDGLLGTIPNEIKNKCSIRKILRSIITLLKINLFQSALLGWLLKKSKFDISAIKIISNSDYLDQIDAKVQHFILLRGYQVKQQLSDSYVIAEVQKELNKAFESFTSLYQSWKPQKSLKNLSLNQINKIFEQWTSKQNTQNKVDYNKLVSKILDLSKSYNVTQKIQQTRQSKKRRKVAQKNVPNNQQIKDYQTKKIQSSKSMRSSPKKYQSFINPLDQQQLDFVEAEDSNNLQLNPMRSQSRNILPRTFTMRSDKSSLLGSGESFRIVKTPSILNSPQGMNLRSSTFDYLKRAESNQFK